MARRCDDTSWRETSEEFTEVYSCVLKFLFVREFSNNQNRPKKTEMLSPMCNWRQVFKKIQLPPQGKKSTSHGFWDLASLISLIAELIRDQTFWEVIVFTGHDGPGLVWGCTRTFKVEGQRVVRDKVLQSYSVRLSCVLAQGKKTKKEIPRGAPSSSSQHGAFSAERTGAPDVSCCDELSPSERQKTSDLTRLPWAVK